MGCNWCNFNAITSLRQIGTLARDRLHKKHKGSTQEAHKMHKRSTQDVVLLTLCDGSHELQERRGRERDIHREPKL